MQFWMILRIYSLLRLMVRTFGEAKHSLAHSRPFIVFAVYRNAVVRGSVRDTIEQGYLQ